VAAIARRVEIARRTARSLAAESLPWAHVIVAVVRVGAVHLDGKPRPDRVVT